MAIVGACVFLMLWEIRFTRFWKPVGFGFLLHMKERNIQRMTSLCIETVKYLWKNLRTYETALNRQEAINRNSVASAKARDYNDRRIDKNTITL